MKLIGDIINDLVDDQLSISVALNKTKILATRIGNHNLLEWVNRELKGYPHREALPAYRKANGTIIGDFLNGTHKVSNFPISLPEVGDGLDEKLREVCFMESAITLELFAKNDNPSLLYQFSEHVRRTIENYLKKANGPHFHLLNIGATAPVHSASQALTAIKNRLMEFMLEMEKEFGLETELMDLQRNNAKINYIMNNTITNNGDGNVVNTGEGSTVNAVINISKGNKEQLAKTLRNNGLNNQDIADLLTVIDTEEPEGNNFGVRVNGWIKKMLEKSLDGTWQTGIGAAGTLLADALKGYYGW